LETRNLNESRHFQKLNVAYFNGITLSISLKLNFTPNILGCYGLKTKSTTLEVENTTSKSYFIVALQNK